MVMHVQAHDMNCHVTTNGDICTCMTFVYIHMCTCTHTFYGFRVQIDVIKLCTNWNSPYLAKKSAVGIQIGIERSVITLQAVLHQPAHLTCECLINPLGKCRARACMHCEASLHEQTVLCTAAASGCRLKPRL